MRGLAMVLGAVLLTSCSKPETPPAEAAAPGINLADLTGTWNMEVRGETGDSVLTSGTIVVGADGSWTMNLPNRPPMPTQATADGDSVMTVAGPFESVLRPGTQVTTHGVMRMVEGRLEGTLVAHYATAGADSVVRLRSTSTRAP